MMRTSEARATVALYILPMSGVESVDCLEGVGMDATTMQRWSE